MNKTIFFISIICCCFAACKSKDQKNTAEANQPVKIKVDTSVTEGTTTKKRPPIINIVDTVIVPQHIIYIKDSASSSTRLSGKLNELFRKRLPAVFAQLGVKPDGPPMVWYKSQQAPFFFEAGQPVWKKPAKLPKPFLLKTLTRDSAVVAHFFGPYDITIMGYEALNDWLQDHKKKKTGPSYEI